jgi:hypothetical protein
LIRFHRRELAILSTWLLGHAAFALYWAPGDLQFWLPVNAGMWLAISILLGRLNANRATVDRPHQGTMLAAGFVSLLFLCINGIGLILPHHFLETNRAYWIAQTVKARTDNTDLILTSGGDRFCPIFHTLLQQTHSVSALRAILGSHYDKQRRSRFWTPRLHKYVPQEDAFSSGFGSRLRCLVGCARQGRLGREDFRRFQTKPSWHFNGETILEVSFP